MTLLTECKKQSLNEKTKDNKPNKSIVSIIIEVKNIDISTCGKSF